MTRRVRGFKYHKASQNLCEVRKLCQSSKIVQGILCIDREQPDALKPYTYMEETQGDIEAGIDPDEKG